MGLSLEAQRARSQATQNIPTFGPEQKKPYVFISYKSDDWQEALDQMVRKLTNEYGLRVYFDKNFDRDNQSWVDNMMQAISSRRCKAVISCISKEYMKSYACAMEIMQARSQETFSNHDLRKIEIIPVIVDGSANVSEAADDSVSQQVLIKEWNDYQEVLRDALECEQNKDTNFKSVLGTVYRKKDKVTEELLASLIRSAVTHERRLNDPNFYENILATLKKEAGDVVFDPELVNSCPPIPFTEAMPAVSETAAPSVGETAESVPVQSVSQPQPTGKIMPDETMEYAAPTESPVERHKKTDATAAAEETKIKEAGEPAKKDGRSEGGRGYSATGDITYKLYDKEYTENQANMMLRFFAQVLKRHPDKVADLPMQRGMNCASAVDYTVPANQTNEMPPYFRSCRYFRFRDDLGICIGTAYGSAEKLRKMALLLELCGEDRTVFSSAQVELPLIKRAKDRETGDAGAGAEGVTYTVYGEKFATNQTDMIGNIFSRVLARHPDKLQTVADQTLVVALMDYAKVPRSERPGYFATLNVYELNGQPYSVGAGIGMKEKLRQIARLLALCGEPISSVTIQGYELEETVPVDENGNLASGRGNSGSVSYTLYGRTYTTNQTDMMGNVFSQVLMRHPEKMKAVAEDTLVVALTDYSAVPKAERPGYFATLNVYELNGQVYSVGAGIGMKEKLRQIAKLLFLCGEPADTLSVQNYEIPQLNGRGKTKRTVVDDFMD